MADQRGAGIVWTDETWNPIRGCRRVSPGCVHCYAETVAARFSGPGLPYEGLVDEHGRWNGIVRAVPHALDQPIRWCRPRRIFVNSMSDLFHESLLDSEIDRVVAAMVLAPQHVFQSLTKRAERQRRYLSDPALPGRLVGLRVGEHRVESVPRWPLPNWHVGVSIESAPYLTRADELAATPAAVRWWSCEPLLGQLGDLRRWLGECNCSVPPMEGAGMHSVMCAVFRRAVDWIVVGGESGSGARPMHPEWARSIRDQAKSADVPLNFKQWGSWLPISDFPEEGYRKLYVSNRKAGPYEDQGEIDELYGTTCSVDQLILRTDGNHRSLSDPEAFRSDRPGWPAMQAFCVGKTRAGRLLDGVEHNGVPDVR